MQRQQRQQQRQQQPQQQPQRRQQQAITPGVSIELVAAAPQPAGGATATTAVVAAHELAAMRYGQMAPAPVALAALVTVVDGEGEPERTMTRPTVIPTMEQELRA